MMTLQEFMILIFGMITGAGIVWYLIATYLRNFEKSMFDKFTRAIEKIEWGEVNARTAKELEVSRDKHRENI